MKKTMAIWIPSCMVVLVFVIYSVVQMIGGVNQEIVYSKMILDAGLAIISVAISVWIGLNIYNIPFMCLL